MVIEKDGWPYTLTTYGATMSEKVAEAAARLRKALEGKEPANHMVRVGEDEAGNPVYGERKPWAQVLAGDVFAVADAVPADKRTQVVKDLRRGTSDLHDIEGLKVQNQTQCLHELLRVYDETAGG